MFLMNHWYVAAEPQEIGREPFGRTLLDQPIVMYRQEDGTPVALEDRCCHRRMPLRRGMVIGDNIRCHYHGLVYGPSGNCIHIPAQKGTPRGMRVRRYPLVERYNWLWVWMGDPALADESTITPYPWKVSEEWADKGNRYHIQCNYQLIADNLLDLSHLAFVHQTTIGNAAVAENATTRCYPADDSVSVVRWTVGKNAPPTFQKAYGFAPDDVVDRWQIIEFTPPCFVRQFSGTGPGAARGKKFGFTDLNEKTPPGCLGLRILHAITPETETTCHYFWSIAHDVAPLAQETTDLLFNDTAIAFHEDWEVFELQQENWDDRPVFDIRVDSGPIQARKLVENLLAEQEPGLAVAAE